MSFNFNLSSDFSAQTQLKILAIQKKDSSWYLDSSVSFHVFSKKNKFTNLWKIIKNSATISIKTNFNTDSIETLKIQVNNQILMLHNSHYNLNTVTNLIFFKMLEWQEFEIEKIRKSDDLYLFRITDLENQVFTANQSDINIYFIQKKISDVLTAAIKKTAAKTDAKSKQKLKSNSESTDSDNNNDNNEIKKKKSIDKTIQRWHQHLEHLNISDIIQLFKNSWSEIKIKKFKFLSFCKTCKLAECYEVHTALWKFCSLVCSCIYNSLSS